MERRETARARWTHGRPDAASSGASRVTGRALHRAGVSIALLTLLVAPAVLAEPAALPPVSAPPPILVARVDPPEAPVVRAAPVVPPAVPATRPTPIEAPLERERARRTEPDLGALLVVRGADPGAGRPATTDELIARAVARGSSPELEPRNPFRKRSRDLFQTERPVSIGDQELLMKLRLRAKASEAVSVEFRF